ncbi:hypothetical protein NY78_1852 [Desulfovibrio sp. TomC]|nr:hypothetical protein NY78_1852 [Desulfovibrio sp. TomC]
MFILRETLQKYAYEQLDIIFLMVIFIVSIRLVVINFT